MNYRTYENDDLVEFYRKLADIYYQSGIDTENIYNILRASGLLNLCLVCEVDWNKHAVNFNKSELLK